MVKIDPVRSQYVQDDEITIFCDSEYQIVDSSKPFVMRVCLSNGTWSGTDAQCERSEGNTFSIIYACVCMCVCVCACVCVYVYVCACACACYNRELIVHSSWLDYQ